MCFCADVPQVHTKTRLVILQHPNERLHPFGTARMVDLALPNARIEVPLARNSGSLLSPLGVPPDAAVLFPHKTAVDLATLPVGERPNTLVVLDGTWSHAKRLYAHNPWLQGLRHVRLHPTEPSRYRIRREPRADFVSTLEAIVAALQILEPDTQGLDALVAAFTRMIDRQIACLQVVERHGRRKRPRQRESRRLPPQLDAPGLLVAYAEVVLPGGDPLAERAVVQWTAARVATGETFDVLIRPEVAWPSDAHLRYIGVSRAALAGGLSVDEARARFAAFAGKDVMLGSWGKNTFAWARNLLPPGVSTFCLKTAYTNLRNRRSGLLDAVVESEGVTPIRLDCQGRAGVRLGLALVLARWLRTVREQLIASPTPSLCGAAPSTND